MNIYKLFYKGQAHIFNASSVVLLLNTPSPLSAGLPHNSKASQAQTSTFLTMNYYLGKQLITFSQAWKVLAPVFMATLIEHNPSSLLNPTKKLKLNLTQLLATLIVLKQLLLDNWFRLQLRHLFMSSNPHSFSPWSSTWPNITNLPYMYFMSTTSVSMVIALPVVSWLNLMLQVVESILPPLLAPLVIVVSQSSSLEFVAELVVATFDFERRT